jgi:hypothetical protein
LRRHESIPIPISVISRNNFIPGWRIPLHGDNTSRFIPEYGTEVMDEK